MPTRSRGSAQPRYLYPDQVASILGCSVRSIYRYMREGLLPRVCLGGRKGNALRVSVLALGRRLIDWGDLDALDSLDGLLSDHERQELAAYRKARRRI